MIGAISGAFSNALNMGVAKYSSVSAEQMIKIERTAKDFEAMFATEMIKPIFDTVPVNSMFGGGNAENIARSFLLQEYGKSVADTGTLGIAPMVKEAMLRLQEASNNLVKGENHDRTT